MEQKDRLTSIFLGGVQESSQTKSPAGKTKTGVGWVDSGFSITYPNVGIGIRAIIEGWGRYLILFQQTGFVFFFVSFFFIRVSDLKHIKVFGVSIGFSIGFDIGMGICVTINSFTSIISEGIN